MKLGVMLLTYSSMVNKGPLLLMTTSHSINTEVPGRLADQVKIKMRKWVGRKKRFGFSFLRKLGQKCSAVTKESKLVQRVKRFIL